jgi:UDP-glucose 4-epimerase
MNILVTGGAGYIGSHTCVSLLQAGHRVIVADHLGNSESAVIATIEQLAQLEIDFYPVDVSHAESLSTIFERHGIDGVIHFAGWKAVGESVHDPLKYYHNNLLSTIQLAQACVKWKVRKFVFSSSATVYGDQESPLREDAELRPTTNPYGETKAISERILRDTQRANPEMAIAILRYFNPVGAHESGAMGEAPQGVPNNLMPYLTRVATGQLEKLRIFGNDYPTIDGTGVRDYIHVMDLAEGHVAALHHLEQGVHVYNLGTGKGTSVLQLLRAFEETNQIQVPYEIVSRRAGDIATCYADATKAERELGWRTQRTIADMCRDAWRFEQRRQGR